MELWRRFRTILQLIGVLPQKVEVDMGMARNVETRAFVEEGHRKVALVFDLETPCSTEPTAKGNLSIGTASHLDVTNPWGLPLRVFSCTLSHMGGQVAGGVGKANAPIEDKGADAGDRLQRGTPRSNMEEYKPSAQVAYAKESAIRAQQTQPVVPEPETADKLEQILRHVQSLSSDVVKIKADLYGAK